MISEVLLGGDSHELTYGKGSVGDPLLARIHLLGLCHSPTNM